MRINEGGPKMRIGGFSWAMLQRIINDTEYHKEYIYANEFLRNSTWITMYLDFVKLLNIVFTMIRSRSNQINFFLEYIYFNL